MRRLMETTGVSVDSTSSDVSSNSNSSSNSNPPSPATVRRTSSSSSSSSSAAAAAAAYSPFPIIRFLQAPVTTIIEYSGVLRPRSSSDYHESETLISNRHHHDHDHSSSGSGSGSGTASNRSSVGENGNGEVSIRIIGGGADHEAERGGEDGEAAAVNRGDGVGVGGGGGGGEREMADSGEVGGGNGGSNSNVDSAYQQRYDLQQVSRWIEQILPFSLLLLIVFIRQHLQGLFVTIYITAFMYKSNDILRKQTALKGERKLSVLAGYFLVFVLHVIGVYWWYQNDDLCLPLFMIPPKAIPPFWHAIFTIIVNDTMVRQAAMSFKLVLLMYYKNGRGHSFRRQGQMLTLVEYTLLLYRAFLPAPVWYRFFLNKEYGSLFSSLTTGLYLTLKLTSVVEKIGSFYTALKALSRKEVNYGSYATPEQVSEAGDLCAICQEKMQAPILLRCKHIFCEDCVSEWFERERTCPLCRALVRPADIRSFGDGSTSLFFQLF
ncbi:hypothetical protein OSB04_026359 [Centaurea solstitialis]|uniref:RING-type domain-containing protein n=1 Tax=Centaurea solstitialis TaxID=347529 RepID=A0AA38SJ82_9ASTR|nr:hypothetical protein OSB04_026359 [Centaurea solstitialis]